MTCAQRRDAIFLHAADQLDANERASLQAHLDTDCPRCVGALAEAHTALARLDLALEPLQPPTALRERLLERAAAGAPDSSADARRQAPLVRARGSLRRPALVGAIAVALAFAAGALVTQSRVAAHASELYRLASESERNRAALGVLASPHVNELDLSGEALGFRGWARMYLDDQSGGCYLRAAVVNKPEAGRSYVLWFTSADGAPRRAGVLEVAENGEATLLTEMPPGVDLSGPIYVTPEPDPSVTAPTAEPLLQALLNQI